jgi:hypothetical protein
MLFMHPSRGLCGWLAICLFLSVRLPAQQAGSGPDSYQLVLLSPSLAGNACEPFAYSASGRLQAEEMSAGEDRLRNCAEWASYMGPTIHASQVYAVLYGLDLAGLEHALDGAVDAALANNAFWKALQQPARAAALSYLLLAKRYEHFSHQRQLRDPWSGHAADTTRLAASLRLLQEQAANKLQSTDDSFLVLRYAYQNVVMARHRGDREQFDQVWKAYFSKARQDDSSIIFSWALHHKAAMTPQAAERSLLAAISFVQCPEKRIHAYQLYDNTQSEAALSMAGSALERASVETLAALKEPGKALPAIQSVAGSVADFPLLKLLFVREINKVEDWLFSEQLSRTNSQQPASGLPVGIAADLRQQQLQADQAYVDALYKSLQQMSPKAFGRDLYALLLGHLALLKKDIAAARRHWAAIGARPAAAVRSQLTKELLLAAIFEKNLTLPKAQEELWSLLQSWQRQQAAAADGYRYRDQLTVYRLISHAFLQQKQLPEAYCFYNYSLDLPKADDYHYSAYYELLRFLDWEPGGEKAIEQLLELLGKPDKSDWEYFLASAPLPSRNALLDLKGTMALRRADYVQARQAFGQVAPSFWQSSYEFEAYLKKNPFRLSALADLQRESGAGFPGKLAVAEALVRLEEQSRRVKNPAQAATALLELGVAWFNFSYYGNSWMMYAYGKRAADTGQETRAAYLPPAAAQRDDYLGMQRAKGYLSKLLALEADKELRAQAAYLLGHIGELLLLTKSKQEEKANPAVWEEFNSRVLSYYLPFSRDYKGSAAYQTITSSCPVLLYYFGSAN